MLSTNQIHRPFRAMVTMGRALIVALFLTNLPSAVAESESMTVLIHGSSTSSGSIRPWFRPETEDHPADEFHEYIQDQVFPDVYDGSDYFEWSGTKTNRAREDAAEELCDWIEAHPTRKLRIIAHSHGCTVVSKALHMGLEAHQIIYLSPLWDSWRMDDDDYPNMANVTVPKIFIFHASTDRVVDIAGADQDFDEAPVADYQEKIVFECSPASDGASEGGCHAKSHDVDTWEQHNFDLLVNARPRMTVIGDTLYMAQSDYVVELAPEDDRGSVLTLNANESAHGSAAITAIDETLFVVQDDNLYRAEPPYCGLELLQSVTWHSTAAMTAIDDTLFIVQNENLYSVSPPYTSYIRLNDGTGTWNNTAAMTAIGDTLYIVQDGNLYSVSPPYNSHTRLNSSAGTWHQTAAMTAIDDTLFIVQPDNLYSVSPPYNGYTRLNDELGTWHHTATMTAIGDTLSIVQNGKLYKVSPPYNGYQFVGQVVPRPSGLAPICDPELPGQERFLRGDANGNGVVQGLLDASYLFAYQFSGGEAPPCSDAADVDDNGELFPLIDGLSLLQAIFADGDALPAPGASSCGEDPTNDALDCEVVSDCVLD